MTRSVTYITTPAGEELVLLPRATYEALIADKGGGTSEPMSDESTGAIHAVAAEGAVNETPLRALRTQAGITQSALAELAAVDIAVVCALEAGEPGIDRAVYERVAAAMNVAPELLMPSGPAGG